MLPWRSPVSLREEAFVLTLEMQTAQFPPTAHKRSNKAQSNLITYIIYKKAASQKSEDNGKR